MRFSYYGSGEKSATKFGLLRLYFNEEGRWRDRALNVNHRRGPVEIRRCLGGTPSVFNPLHWVGRCEMGEGGVDAGKEW